MHNLTKHSEIFNQGMLENTPVHIIGCGATGSNIAFQLAKLGIPELHLYDMDKVEEHNIANQMFSESDIGRNKAVALKDILHRFGASEITSIGAHTEKVDENYIAENPLTGIIFCATDTMGSRKEIFEAAAYANVGVKRWIEMRLSLSYVMIYSIRPTNLNECEKYAQTLYSSEEVVETSACGTSQTAMPTASILAGACVWEMLNDLNSASGSDIDHNEILIDIPTWTIMKRKFG